MPGCLRIGIAVTLLYALLFPLAGCGKKEDPKAATSTAQPGAKSRKTSVTGVVVELIECKRKDGVLTVQLQFRNTGDKSVTFYPVSRGNFDPYYVTAEDKKYLVLRDEEKTPLAPPVNPVGDVYVSLAPGATWVWWAKYPAPPPAVKKISYYTSLTPPFDDIPISDQ